MNIVSRNDIVTDDFLALCAEIKALGRTWTFVREETPVYETDDHNERVISHIDYRYKLRVVEEDASLQREYDGCPLEIIAESRGMSSWKPLAFGMNGSVVLYMLADESKFWTNKSIRDVYPNSWNALKDACGLV